MRTDSEEVPLNPSENMIRTSVTEAIGTFILVFAGASVVTAAALGKPIAGVTFNSLAVGLTFGLVLAAIVAAIGHVSGAHVNPAVTLGLASVGRFPWRMVPGYIIGQLVGAIIAALCVWGIFGDPARGTPALGATFPTAGTSVGMAFLAEFLITFILMFVIMGVATDDRANKAAASMAIGFALGVAVLIAGPVSGGSANPARTLGPMIVAAKFTAVWVYIVAPIIGAVAAAWIYEGYVRKAALPKPEEETSVLGRAA